MLRGSIVLFASLLLAAVAGAHPGHGDPAHTSDLAHYLGEPLHVVGGFALGVALLAVTRFRSRSRQPAR